MWPFKNNTDPNIALIVVLGDSGVGKTCFADMFLEGKPFISYSPVAPDTRLRDYKVDSEAWQLRFMDISSTTLTERNQDLYTKAFDSILKKADGIVLLYDVTSEASFEGVTNEGYEYVLKCRDPQGESFGCVLVGNKTDLVDADEGRRKADGVVAEKWAAARGLECFEVTTKERGQVEKAVEGLVRHIKSEMPRKEGVIDGLKGKLKLGTGS